MQFSSQDFVSGDFVVSSVARLVGDADFKKVPKGRYDSITYRALLDLGFQTFFNKKRFDEPVPQDLQLPLPANTFGVKEVYVFNGDACNIGSAQKLYYKENYYTRGNGFFAKNRAQEEAVDPYFPADREFVRIRDTNMAARREERMSQQLLYYSIENGVMYISPACRVYQKLHIVAYGTNTPLGEVPLVPTMFINAVEDYVAEFITRELITYDPKIYAGMNTIYNNRLQKFGMNGSWHEAVKRIRTMDKGRRDDWAEYYSRWSW